MTSVLAGLAGTGLTSIASAQDEAEESEPPQDQEQPNDRVFSFDLLTEMMRERAGNDYVPIEAELPAPLADLDYDRHRAIRFRRESAVWRDESPLTLQAFHMGWLFQEPVRLYSVENGQSHPIEFTSDDFEYGGPLDPAQFEDVQLPGIAGFRLHYGLNRPDVMDELASFLGASYFRALGRGNVYGLSARGLAVNTATQSGEQFPRFDTFYVQKPAADARDFMLWATMDGQSVTGAFQFHIRPGDETVIDVTARLFLRQDIERLGIAPLTSMFLFARNNRAAFRDFRNGVHDSDGLKLVRRSGEELWRNLNNPGRLATSFFSDDSPAAFGLMQRDREFENYQDSEASYERRPSLLIEPLDDWGPGHVALIEIPTALEINDNIVAFWIPEGGHSAGQELEFRYRMRWGDIEESQGTYARVRALRAGEGGVSGVPNTDGLQKFVVDFEGGPLGAITSGTEELESVVRVWNAEIVNSTLSRIRANGMWRLALDIGSIGDRPVEMSAYLTLAGTRVSETWLYQWRSEDDRQR